LLGGRKQGICFLALASKQRIVHNSAMAITKVFRRGNRQAVRIPKNLRVHSEQAEITKHESENERHEQPTNLAAAFGLLTRLSSDFFKGGRRQPKIDKRIEL